MTNERRMSNSSFALRPSSPRYSALLFDLDGTLIDSADDLVESVRQGLAAIGLPPPAREKIVHQVGKPLVDFPSLLGYHLNEEQTSRFATAYRAWYAIHFADHTEPYPGVREALLQLRTGGYRLAVITTKRQDQADSTLRGIGLASGFDYIRGWQEGRKLKPDPEPVVETLKVLAVPRDHALMVGDSEQDILAAQAAGVDCCACLYGFRDPEYLLSLHPTYSIRSFPELMSIVLAGA